MMQTWRTLAGRFEVLATRERLLIFVATLVGTALVLEALLIQPLEARRQRLSQQLVQTRLDIRTAEEAVKVQESAPDSLAVKRTYRDALRRQLADVDARMQRLKRGLVPPEKMARLLEDLLASGQGGLQLVSLKTLPTRRFDAPEAAPAGRNGARPSAARPEPGRTLYQHSFELTLQGGYADLHAFLSRVEKLPWRVFWGRIEVDAREHPRLRARLTVRTLSLNEAWLIV